jgi:hypothetical protein
LRKPNYRIRNFKGTGHVATTGAGCHESHNKSFLFIQPNFLLTLIKIPINKSGIDIAKDISWIVIAVEITCIMGGFSTHRGISGNSDVFFTARLLMASF